MNIKETKEKMLQWKDHAGFDIADRERIDKAKTKQELKQILLDHRYWIEMSFHLDHMRSVDTFISKLKL